MPSLLGSIVGAKPSDGSSYYLLLERFIGFGGHVVGDLVELTRVMKPLDDLVDGGEEFGLALLYGNGIFLDRKMASASSSGIGTPRRLRRIVERSSPLARSITR